jgi:catechol 2,3-dioxygenase-like lactoylglutathione lyase family enzyme
MLGSSEVMAFVATADPKAAKRFYASVLGLKFVSDDGYALLFDANGVMLRVQKVEKLKAQPHTQLGWKVEGLSAIVRGLTKKGVRFERYGFPGVDALGIWSAPGGAKVAWFKDPDGNLLSLTEL